MSNTQKRKLSGFWLEVARAVKEGAEDVDAIADRLGVKPLQRGGLELTLKTMAGVRVLTLEPTIKLTGKGYAQMRGAK